MKLAIFCDFDGTITTKDVGDALFRKFGNFEKHWQEFIEGECNVRELNKRLYASIPKSVTLADIKEFVIQHEVDAYFLPFINYCKMQGHSFTVVSDGYDIYIYEILKKLDASINKIFCNKLYYENGKFTPSFFGADENCKCLTASCKRNVVLTNSSDDDILVYIGDGMTDFCAAEHCDIIFAKSQLAKYCNENKIPHHPFKSFFDVKRTIETLVAKKNIKRRNQAFLKRKNAFEAE